MRFGCLLFLLPFAEFALILLVGRWIGGWEVVGVVAGMSLIGLVLVQREARRLKATLGSEIERGGALSRSLIDSVSVLMAGFLFMVPGFLTDLVGILLVVPGSRRLFSRWIQATLLAGAARGGMRVMTWGSGMAGGGEKGRDERPPRPGEIIQ